jgi:hypothetical protein
MAHRKPIVPEKRPAQRRKQGLPLALWLGIAGVLVLVAGIMLIFRPAAKPEPPQVTGKPRLQVSQDVLDFGKVALNRPVKATFKLKNVGDQDLYVRGTPQIEVKQGC